MIWPAIIAAGASLVGGIMGNKASAKEAESNRNFQADMSNSSYQRSMKDMELAGLNPILAYKTGGASTPSGSMAQQNDVISPAVNTAMQAMRTKEELGIMKKEQLLKGEQVHATAAQTWKTTQDRHVAAATEKLIKEQTKGTAYENSLKKAEADFYKTPAGQAIRAAGIIQQNVGGFIPFTNRNSPRSR